MTKPMDDDLLRTAYERWRDDLDIEKDQGFGLLGDPPRFDHDGIIREAWKEGVQWLERQLAQPEARDEWSWDTFRETAARIWQKRDGVWRAVAPPGVRGLWEMRAEEANGAWKWYAATRYVRLVSKGSPPGVRGSLPKWHVGYESATGCTALGEEEAKRRSVEALIVMLECVPSERLP